MEPITSVSFSDVYYPTLIEQASAGQFEQFGSCQRAQIEIPIGAVQSVWRKLGALFGNQVFKPLDICFSEYEPAPHEVQRHDLSQEIPTQIYLDVLIIPPAEGEHTSITQSSLVLRYYPGNENDFSIKICYPEQDNGRILAYLYVQACCNVGYEGQRLGEVNLTPRQTSEYLGLIKAYCIDAQP